MALKASLDLGWGMNAQEVDFHVWPQAGAPEVPMSLVPTRLREPPEAWHSR